MGLRFKSFKALNKSYVKFLKASESHHVGDKQKNI
jgi:hypothetical protein